MKRVTGRALLDQEAEVKFKSVLAINRTHAAFGYFAVRKISKNAFIGLCKIVLPAEEDAKIGYLLMPERWGKGYGSETMQCLVERGGSVSKLQTLSAIIDPENVASISIFEKHNLRLLKAITFHNISAQLYKCTIL